MDLKLARTVRGIQSSNYSLKCIENLHERGYDFGSLNSCHQGAKVICNLVSHNYGLGLRILSTCGINLACVDPDSGNSPLLLAAAEGLCGAIRFLIEAVPPEHLLHCNHSGRSALLLLLARGHGACGCLSALLSRLPPRRCLFPPGEADGNTVRANLLVLSVGELLARIKCSQVQRVLSVFRLWTGANLIRLQTAEWGPGDALESSGKQTSEDFINALLPNIFRAGSFGTSNGEASEACINDFLEILCRLIILGTLRSECLTELLLAPDHLFIDEQQAEAVAKWKYLKSGLRSLAASLHPIAPLRHLCIRIIRRELQRTMCKALSTEHVEDGCLNIQNFFQHQVDSLCCPSHLRESLHFRTHSLL
ncbi:hypothetical protein AAHC03_09150 [Spirometra sp. Aus1]